MKDHMTVRILLALCVSLTAFGFYALQKSSPEELGLFRASVDDSGLLELAVDQLRQDLATGKLARIETVLLNEFTQKNATTEGPEAQKLHFLKKNESSRSLSDEKLPKINLRAQKIAIEGDQAVIQAELSAGNRNQSRVALRYKKANNTWRLHKTEGLAESLVGLAAIFESGQQAGADGFMLYRGGPEDLTLRRRTLSPEHDIEKLTKAVTRNKLARDLFGKPYVGVLISSVQQHERAPFFSARYVQLVTDPAWNRIIYGDYDGWIKAYGPAATDDSQEQSLNRPHGIDRDSQDRVYVADTGNNRVVVLSLAGSGADTELRFEFDFGAAELSQPYDVAWDDAGTPFETNDDVVWVTDTGHHRILGYDLEENEARLRYAFGTMGKDAGQFFTPKGITPGRFNGVCSSQLYVADSGNRRIVKLSVNANELIWQNVFHSQDESQFSSVDVDHWGNVYIADRSYREIHKLSADLEPLAVLPGEQHSLIDPVNFRVVFGRVDLESEQRQVWAGYDQAFAIEKWSENSGAERYQLGVDLTDFNVSLSGDLSRLSVNSKLTDHAEVSLSIINDKTNQTVRQTSHGWMVAGDKHVIWDRRDDSGHLVEPGFYRLQLAAQSSYGASSAMAETPAFYLPLYYHEDSGSDVQTDSHLLQGVRSQEWGTRPHETIVKHPSEVVYRFTDLNPNAQYEISAEFYNKVGDYLKQEITVDEAFISDDFELPVGIKRVTWQPLPGETYADGEIEVHIRKIGGQGHAMVSQLWLRQANFDPANPPVQQQTDSQIPEAFSLSQNYPNPFNPSTTIEFGVPAGASHMVTLKIYNMLGQTVKVLINEPMPPGRHSIVWNGLDDFNRPIASGVYFYRMQAGDVTQVKKLILMK